MIVLADLDNTLLDRDAAFRMWATGFLGEVGKPTDLAWLLAEDADGYRPRAELAQSLRDRYQLPNAIEDLVERLLGELVELTTPYPGVMRRLRMLREAGAAVVIVTNGTTRQQTAKLTRTGLLDTVTGVMISEALGVKKPSPQIFHDALRLAGHRNDGPQPWMVGDHIAADMAGAHALGLATGWVSHGRSWTQPWLPTFAAHQTVQVLDHLLTFCL